MAGDDGAAVVEFALLLPFLAILVFGTIDLARVFQLKNRVTNAAREGVALGQFQPQFVNRGCNNGSNIRNRVDREEPDLVGEDGYGIIVSRSRTDTAPDPDVTTLTPYDNGPTDGTCLSARTAADGTPITFDRNIVNPDKVVVQVTVEFQVLTPLISAFVGDEIPVTGRSEGVIQG